MAGAIVAVSTGSGNAGPVAAGRDSVGFPGNAGIRRRDPLDDRIGFGMNRRTIERILRVHDAQESRRLLEGSASAPLVVETLLLELRAAASAR